MTKRQEPKRLLRRFQVRARRREIRGNGAGGGGGVGGETVPKTAAGVGIAESGAIANAMRLNRAFSARRRRREADATMITDRLRDISQSFFQVSRFPSIGRERRAQ